MANLYFAFLQYTRAPPPANFIVMTSPDRILSSLRSRRLVRAGEERASFEETAAQMPMINLFFSEESSEKLPIGQSR
jgi:hypothetical protein